MVRNNEPLAVLFREPLDVLVLRHLGCFPGIMLWIGGTAANF
jgi:hypothetical protein